METYHKKSKIGRGNRPVRGLFNCIQHGFLQTRETVPLTSPSAYFGETCCEESTLEHPPYHVHILQSANLGFLNFSFTKAAIIQITSTVQNVLQMLTVR